MHLHLGSIGLYIAWHTFWVCMFLIPIATWVVLELINPRPKKRVKLYVVGKPVADERDSIQQFKRRVN